MLNGPSHIRPGDQRGATAIETAIILIAFVVVASVFAFAILSAGVLSTEKTGETVLGGVADTSVNLALRGGGSHSLDYDHSIHDLRQQGRVPRDDGFGG